MTEINLSLIAIGINRLNVPTGKIYFRLGNKINTTLFSRNPQKPNQKSENKR